MIPLIKGTLLVFAVLYFISSFGTKDKDAQFYFMAGTTLVVVLLAADKFL